MFWTLVVDDVILFGCCERDGRSVHRSDSSLNPRISDKVIQGQLGFVDLDGPYLDSVVSW